MDVFPTMFPDSQIATKMKLYKDKIAYITVHGLAHHFQKVLTETLEFCSHIVAGFNDCLNEVAKKNQRDLILRFWDDMKMRPQQDT